MSLEIRQVTLAQLLSHPEVFQMARYQRHYEWGRKEMESLLDDLDDVFAEHLRAPENRVYHFLGTIILYPVDAGPLEVVDGQQRLTSLTVLLAMARCHTPDPTLRAALTPLLTVAPATPATPQPRVQLHRGDQAFLVECVLAANKSSAFTGIPRQDRPSAEYLRTNALIALDWIASKPPAQVPALMAFILAGCRFAELRVRSEDDAFRIFETVNNRGRPIASEDVLRYALVEYATPDPGLREDFLARWDGMESRLGPRGMKRFIASWRARAAKGARPRLALHRIVLESFTSPAEARAFLDTQLSGDVEVFQQVEQADIALPDGPEKKRIDTILCSLSLLDFDEWLPVAVELVARGSANPALLAVDLARLERLAWFYYLNRDDKGIYQDRRDRFSQLMRTVVAAGTFEGLPHRSLLSTEQCSKMRDIVQERLDPKWIPLRSLLVRLEMALANDGACVARGDVTIEHVLPLNPEAKAWKALFGNDRRIITEYAQQIGNLCLVSSELNTQLGNRIYSAKRALMLKAGVPATSALAADFTGDLIWNRAVIERRSKWLLGVFCDTFDVHPAHR